MILYEYLAIIIILLCLFMIIRYAVIMKKRISEVTKQLSELINKIFVLTSNRMFMIKSGYNFVSVFEKIYKKYKPYQVLVYSFLWNDTIKNFKINNIIRIKEGDDIFNILKEYQQIPISGIPFLNNMIINKDKYINKKISDNKGICKICDVNDNHIFLRLENGLPIFMCIISYKDSKKFEDCDILDVLNSIEKISY